MRWHTWEWAYNEDRSNAVHRTVQSSHPGLVEAVRPAEASVRDITEVITSVRTHTPLPPR